MEFLPLYVKDRPKQRMKIPKVAAFIMSVGLSSKMEVHCGIEISDRLNIGQKSLNSLFCLCWLSNVNKKGMFLVTVFS